MKKLVYIVAAGMLLVETGCSTIDASTANSVPSTNGYTNAVMSNNASGGGPSVVGRANVPNAMNLDASSTAAKPMSDVSFVMDAVSSSMLEMKLGEMAVQKAMDPEVKQFGQMMVDHHAEATKELTPIASRLDMDLPTTLTEDQLEILNKVSKKSGAEFDKVYMDTMEELHQTDINKFYTISNSGGDIALKAYAAKTLPMLQAHLNKASKLEDKVSK